MRFSCVFMLYNYTTKKPHKSLFFIKKTYGLVNFQHKKHLTNLYGLKSEKLCFLTIICKRFKHYKKGHLLNVQKSKKLRNFIL